MQLSLFSECQSKLQICSSERNIRLLPVGWRKDNLENVLVSIQRKCNLLEYLTQRDIQTKNSGGNVRYRGKHRFFKGFNEFIKEKTRRCDNDFEKIERHVFF